MTDANRATKATDASEKVEEDDVTLVRAVARHDRRAFEELYYRHSRRLARYLMRILRQPAEVDEALNDAMLVLWQNASRFDPAASRFTTWLFGIAHNKALKVLAARRPGGVEVSMQGSDGERLDDAEPEGAIERADAHDPERTYLGRELGGLLAKALEQLSPEHRAVIQLAFGEDCSYEEIASITGSPLNTVKTRMFHARKRLAEIMGRYDAPRRVIQGSGIT